MKKIFVALIALIFANGYALGNAQTPAQSEKAYTLDIDAFHEINEEEYDGVSHSIFSHSQLGDDNMVDTNGKPITGLIGWWIYNSNENKGCEAHYKNGRKEGVELCFENGKKSGEIPYKNGKKHGIVKWYYENGKTKEETPYKNGLANGVSREYHTNGNVRYETPYKNGTIMEGVAKWHYEDGGIEQETIYKDNEIVVEKCYHENGKIKSKIPYKNMDKNGVARYYDKNGKLEREATFKNDVQNGLERKYLPNGAILEFQYKDGGNPITGFCVSASGKRTELTKDETDDHLWNTHFQADYDYPIACK
ncbi:MAG: toxin-antitoxin system YwqK family antitoxin [Zoogloeaceae bacterium]|jgi:antitoxin component YwqK of YwqJK toxin-antitoxin module|nr:toxin-antitoxin system YwqK family antitoxin [Zoogloeaceae bacterium]